MRRFGKILGRILLTLLVLVALLLAPVAYNEAACRGDDLRANAPSLLPPEHHRPEARSLLTYPEWHIVHAYDDYARVISEGDPHDFGYARAIGGFWSSLCALSKSAPEHGGFPWEVKQMVYTIGVSFTAELLFKAAYEETLGRAATWVRGPEPATLDTLSAAQAATYAKFLQQVPWYKYDFRADKAALTGGQTFRDSERRFALGVEYGGKAGYAGLIAKAAAATIGPDELTLQMVVTGVDEAQLAALDGVTILKTLPEGIIVQTPRYRELTHLLVEMAQQGAEFVEIAGNDDIMFTATGTAPAPDALHSFARQGYGDTRSLVLLPVKALAQRLRDMARGPLTLEHIHDY